MEFWNKRQRFSIRKLNNGIASVLIGIALVGFLEQTLLRQRHQRLVLKRLPREEKQLQVLRLPLAREQRLVLKQLQAREQPLAPKQLQALRRLELLSQERRQQLQNKQLVRQRLIMSLSTKMRVARNFTVSNGPRPQKQLNKVPLPRLFR